MCQSAKTFLFYITIIQIPPYTAFKTRSSADAEKPVWRNVRYKLSRHSGFVTSFATTKKLHARGALLFRGSASDVTATPLPALLRRTSCRYFSSLCQIGPYGSDVQPYSTKGGKVSATRSSTATVKRFQTEKSPPDRHPFPLEFSNHMWY